MQPKLSLVYNSQVGNGLLGVGWSLAGLSVIHRCPQTLVQDGKIHGVDFTSEDRFCLDGSRLIAVSGDYGGEGTEYRTEIDAYQKIVSYGSNPADPDYFEVRTKSGQIIEYGNTDDSRIEAQGRAEARVWAVNRIKDTVGNYIQFSYIENNDNGSYHVDYINYAGNENTGDLPAIKVNFGYAHSHPSPLLLGIPKYVAGSKIQIESRLSNIKINLNGSSVRNYHFSFEKSKGVGHPRLSVLVECDENDCKPPYTFQWSQEIPTNDGFVWPYVFGRSYLPVQTASAVVTFGPSGDFNGDGRTDFIALNDAGASNQFWHIQLSATYGLSNFISLEYNPGTLGSAWFGPSGDFNGDGLTDFIAYNALSNDDKGWVNDQNQMIHISNGEGRFTQQPYRFGNFNGGRFGPSGDFNGDGITDFITYRQSSSTNSAWANDENQIIHLSDGSGEFVKYSYQFGNYANGRFGPNGDFNGDGLTDFITYQAISETDAGWAGSISPVIHFSNGNGTFKQISFQTDIPGGNQFGPTGDVNGDGLTDFISFNVNSNNEDSDFAVHFSKGNGTFSIIRLPIWNVNGKKIGPAGDFNGDGLMDFSVLRPKTQTSLNDYYQTVFFSKGDGSFNIKLYSHEDGLRSTLGPGGDFNGDGLSDFVDKNNWNDSFMLHQSNFWAPNTVINLPINVTGMPNKLISINTGGKQTLISYQSIANYPIDNYGSIYTKHQNANFPARDVIGPIYVVSAYTVSNGIGGTSETRYIYEGAKAHMQGRGFLGFSKIEKTHMATGMVVTTQYNQDYAASGLDSDWPKAGLIDSETTTLTDGRIVNEIVNKWEVVNQDNGTYQLRQSQTDEKKYELESGGANYLVSHITSYNNRYDAFGNVEELVIDSNDGYTTTTRNWFYNDQQNWYLGRLMTATVTKTSPTTPPITRKSLFTYNWSTGLLNSEVIEPGNADLELITSYTHDAYGNRTSTIVKGNPQATYPIEEIRSSQEWDYSALTSSGTYTVTTTNTLGHSETKVIDARFGVPLSLTGPNGLTTRWTYDSFGRLQTETRADGTSTTHTYSYCGGCPASAVYSITKQNTGSTPVISWFDKMGRILRTQTTGLNNKTIYKDTQYNQLGQVSQTSQPYFSTDAGSIYWYQYQYDNLGRIVMTVSLDNVYIFQNYMGLTTTLVNTTASILEAIKTKNSQGQVVQIIDAHQESTTYEYDAYGNLVQVTDAALNVTSMEYDLRGRKISMNDLDMGHWEYRYDALGNLRWQKDAKGQVVTMQYDKLNRIVKQIEPEGENTWIFDMGNKGIGKLYNESSAYGDQRYYLYDQFGRQNMSVTVIGGIGYINRKIFDAYSRVKMALYPSNFSITNIYDANGYLTEVQNAANQQSYWKADYADASGRLTQQTYGNNVTTTQSYKRMGQVASILTGLGQGSELQYLNYDYDVRGNLIERQNLNSNQTETFVYDRLSRLKEANIVGIGGKSYDYDAIGNIIYKSDVGVYEYAGFTGGPHAVTMAGSDRYFYDFNGNQVFANYNGSTSVRFISYTSFNRPVTVSAKGGSATYYYDANHQRIKKISNKDGVTNTTIYLGKGYEEVHKGSGSVDRKHYISVGSATVIFTKTTYADSSTQEKIRYLHKDHLGSTDVVTDENGAVTDRMSFDAHGLYRGALDWSNVAAVFDASLTRGFTGHEMDDEVGLINMNARMYDPKLGRFLQADTVIQFPYSSQGYNRYTYTNNNPLTFTDPSGQFLSGLKKFVKDNKKTIVIVAAATISGGAAMSLLTGGNLGLSALAGAGFNVVTATVAAGVGAATGFTTGAIATGNLNGALRGAAVGAATGTAFNAVGGLTSEWYTQMPSHGVVGGLQSEALGGDFRSGFAGGFVAKGVTILGGIKPMQHVPRGIMTTIVGGAAAQAAGGKFANRAASAAFVNLLTAAADYYKRSVGQESDIRPGENRADQTTYTADPRTGRQPLDTVRMNVIGNNDLTSICRQGSGCSKFLNLVPGINATARLHDYWFNAPNAPDQTLIANVGTMLPAAAIGYSAVAGNFAQGWQNNPTAWYYISQNWDRN